MVSRCSEANFGVQQVRSAGPAHTGAWPGVGRRDGARGHGVSESAGVAERRLGGSKACNADSALKKKKKRRNKSEFPKTVYDGSADSVHASENAERGSRPTLESCPFIVLECQTSAAH